MKNPAGSKVRLAAWASKQAGRSIRNEEVPEPLKRFVGINAPLPSLWTPRGWLRRKPFLAYVRVTAEDLSGHLAEGNRRRRQDAQSPQDAGAPSGLGIPCSN